MSVRIDTTQVKAFSRELQTVSGRVGARASAALRKTAFDIEADAKASAPVDTGSLRSSIEAAFSGDGRNGSMSASVTAHAGYSLFVHEGTSTMGAQPFLANAFDRRYPGLEKALADVGQEAI